MVALPAVRQMAKAVAFPDVHQTSNIVALPGLGRLPGEVEVAELLPLDSGSGQVAGQPRLLAAVAVEADVPGQQMRGLLRAGRMKQL